MSLFPPFLQTKSIPAEESHGPKESTERKGTFFRHGEANTIIR